MNGDSLFLKFPEIASAIADHLFDAIVIYKVDAEEIHAVFANNPFYKLTGFTAEEVIGRGPLFSNPKSNSTKLYTEVVDSILLKSNFDKDIFCLNKNGNPFWAYLRSIPLKVAGNHFHILIFRDVTRIRQKESELKKAFSEAEESKKMKDRFLTNMSHEMRTPINGILGMAQLLEESGLTGEQHDYLEELRLSSETLQAIVNDILEFNFIESGALNLESRKFSIRKHLNQIFDTLKERAEKKNLKMEMVVSDKVPEYLVGDVVRFSQILMHVIGNAIKFTKNGSVNVFVRKLELSTERAPIEVKVQDTGIGIPRDLLDNVFESFNKAARFSTYKYGGTGLGLAISDQLVRRMDGKMEVESKEGHGTTFTVSIPFEVYQKMDAGPADIQPEDDVSAVTGARVLVVDDYMINRRIVKGILEKMGNEVYEAEDGEKALKMIADNDYSIILMDVHMPGMGGLETTRKIREMEDPAKRNIPVVAITASVLERDIKECREAGMDDFIAKPFTKGELTNRVKLYVENERQPEAGRPSVFRSVEESEFDSGQVSIEPLMEMTDGDIVMAREMAELFIRQTPELFGKIRDCYNQNDYEKMSLFAHTLKPTFNYVGFENGYRLTLKIEEEGKAENPDEKALGLLIDKLEKLCEMSVDQLKEKMSVLS
jgi:PAS domain S-box-containing protein